MRLSKSKIGTWEKCPFLFKLKYIDGKAFDVKTPQMERGNEIHKLMEDYYKPEVKTIENLNKEITKQEKFVVHKEAVENFIKFNKRWNDSIPLYTEQELYDETYNIIGIIDRIGIRDNKIILWDYKSGQLHDLGKYRFELALYTYLFEINHNQKVDYWGIFFVDHNVDMIEPVNRQEMQKAIEKVVSIRKEIKACSDKNEFCKKFNYDCRWCKAQQSGECDGATD